MRSQSATRKVGRWIIALCVGFTAMMFLQAVVGQMFIRVTGPLAVVYAFSLPLVFGFTTAAVVTWLETTTRRPNAASKR